MTEAQRESLCALIRQAGAHAQALRDAGLQVDKKSRQDFVSQADLAVEQQIKGWLQAHFPQEGFLGEESGFAGDEQTVWVLDPVDGTTNFILGMDYWCISLARVCQGELTLGIIYAPDRDEFFFAGRGEGAYLNGQRLTLREPDPDAVVVGMGRSSRAPASDYAQAIATLLDAGLEYRRFGAGALMLAHVAAGQLHAYYEAHMNSWDALAGMLLIEETGESAMRFSPMRVCGEATSCWRAAQASSRGWRPCWRNNATPPAAWTDYRQGSLRGILFGQRLIAQKDW